MKQIKKGHDRFIRYLRSHKKAVRDFLHNYLDDAISEGINLHAKRAASQVIHYELPWNPNCLGMRIK